MHTNLLSAIDTHINCYKENLKGYKDQQSKRPPSSSCRETDNAEILSRNYSTANLQDKTI